MPKLTAKQATYVEEYLVDLNQTQAAIRAGYAPKNAAKMASELMTKPVIRDAIAVAMAARSARTGVNADRVVRELARVALSQPGKVIRFRDATVIEGATEDDLAAIASVKVKTIPTADGEGIEREVRMADKVKALELLGKHLSMFTEKVSLFGALPVQIVDDVPHTAAVVPDEEAGDDKE